MDEIQCDFCNSREPVWRYPCTSFGVFIKVSDNTEIPWGSQGDWAACEICSNLIEEGEWEKLARRGVDMNPLAVLAKDMLPSGEIERAVLRMHRMFRERRGERVPNVG